MERICERSFGWDQLTTQVLAAQQAQNADFLLTNRFETASELGHHGFGRARRGRRFPGPIAEPGIQRRTAAGEHGYYPECSERSAPARLALAY